MALKELHEKQLMEAGIKKLLKENKTQANAEHAPAAFKWDPREHGRAVLFPILHPSIWEFRKTTERLRWVVEDVDLSKDLADWKRMSEPKRQATRFNLAMFAVGDNPVLENCLRNFSRRVNCMEASVYYAGQADGEAVHMEAYMKQIDAISENGDERRTILGGPDAAVAQEGKHEAKRPLKDEPEIAAITRWINEWLDKSDSAPIGESLVAFAMFEGVIFSGSFCFIQWLREEGVLRGVTSFNEFIARDEGLHCRFACMLIREYLSDAARPSQETVEKIANSAYKVAAAMADASMPEALSGGMSAELLKSYLKFQIDVVVALMGHYKPVSGIDKNPCKWMDKLSLNEVKKVNFFEARVSQYQGASAGAAEYYVDESEPEY